MIELDAMDFEWIPSGETILDAIYDGRVFCIDKVDDGFVICEDCDAIYSVKLTKEQMLLRTHKHSTTRTSSK